MRLWMGPFLGLLLTVAVAHADTSIRRVPVEFGKGEASALIKGRIDGDQVIDYQVRAGAGQSMHVDFRPDNPSAYFNLTAPGSDAAMFVGSTSGNRFEGVLPAAGIYTVRVYLMRNASRRGESASYSLEVGIAAVPRTADPRNIWPSRWDASGSVKCSMGNASLGSLCDFRVVRDRPGQKAEVWFARRPNDDGGYRFIRYENKSFTTNDGAKLSWQRSDDNWILGVDGREHYLIPDALLFGG